MDSPELPLLESRRMNAQLTETAPVITVNTILERYEREGMHDLAPRTKGDYLRHLRHLKRLFGHLTVAELEPRIFAEYLNGQRKGQQHKVRRLAVLSSAFTMAVKRWWWMKSNCLRDVDRPKNKPRDRLIRDEEFEACRALAPQRVGLAMQLALLTGQRQGDIIDFKWSDIRESVIDDLFNPGYQKRVSEIHLQQGKTGKRIAIEITSDLESVLDECWLLKKGGHAGSAYILPTRKGTPYTSESFRAAWQRVRLKWERGGGEPMHFHDIRALAATKCKSLEEASQLLGHTSTALTRKIYRRGVERVRPLNFSVMAQQCRMVPGG